MEIPEQVSYRDVFLNNYDEGQVNEVIGYKSSERYQHSLTDSGVSCHVTNNDSNVVNVKKVDGSIMVVESSRCKTSNCKTNILKVKVLSSTI